MKQPAYVVYEESPIVLHPGAVGPEGNLFLGLLERALMEKTLLMRDLEISIQLDTSYTSETVRHLKDLVWFLYSPEIVPCTLMWIAEQIPNDELCFVRQIRNRFKAIEKDVCAPVRNYVMDCERVYINGTINYENYHRVNGFTVGKRRNRPNYRARARALGYTETSI